MSLPTTQTRVVVAQFNPADPASTLEVTSGPVPKPSSGEVLVRLTCRPINPADVFSVMGVYPGFTPKSLPAVPGLEGCGVIADANGCEGLSDGMRGVCFANTKDGEGTWQEYVVVAAASFMPVPDSVPDSSAAQFLVNPITVLGMLDVLEIPAGEYLIQTAAGSVLGRQLITICKARGIKTINVIRRADGKSELLELGADHVVVSTTEDAPARIQEITGSKGAYAAVDAVAGDMTAVCTGGVRSGGTVMVYGAMSGIEYKGSVVDTLFRQVTTRGFWLNVWLGSLTPARKGEVFGDMLKMLADGSMVPLAGKTFELKDCVAAFKHSQSEARGGKVLLVSP